jgi:hypothetical protein
MPGDASCDQADMRRMAAHHEQDFALAAQVGGISVFCSWHQNWFGAQLHPAVVQPSARSLSAARAAS